MPIKLGELLVKENLITPQQLQEALQYQKQHGGKLGYNLVKLGFVKDEEITQLLSRQYGVPSINLARFEIDPSVTLAVPPVTIPATRRVSLRFPISHDPVLLGLDLWWIRPIAQAPRRTASAASSGLVIPQTFTFTRQAYDNERTGPLPTPPETS